MKSQVVSTAFIKGILLTFVIALMAKGIASLPFFAMMGQLVLAMLIGIGWKAN
jgi:hypothetical protein